MALLLVFLIITAVVVRTGLCRVLVLWLGARHIFPAFDIYDPTVPVKATWGSGLYHISWMQLVISYTSDTAGK